LIRRYGLIILILLISSSCILRSIVITIPRGYIAVGVPLLYHYRERVYQDGYVFVLHPIEVSRKDEFVVTVIIKAEYDIFINEITLSIFGRDYSVLKYRSLREGQELKLNITARYVEGGEKYLSSLLVKWSTLSIYMKYGVATWWVNTQAYFSTPNLKH